MSPRTYRVTPSPATRAFCRSRGIDPDKLLKVLLATENFIRDHAPCTWPEVVAGVQKKTGIICSGPFDLVDQNLGLLWVNVSDLFGRVIAGGMRLHTLDVRLCDRKAYAAAGFDVPPGVLPTLAVPGRRALKPRFIPAEVGR